MRKQSPVSSSPAQETLGEALSEQAFTADQASRLTGCTPHQLRYWDRVGLVKPSIQGTGDDPVCGVSTPFGISSPSGS